jgi:MFS family permease
MWTAFMASLMHMIGMAITPAINRIATTAFPQHPLASIQTALSLSGIVMPCVSLLTAILIRRGFLTKKDVVVIGLFILGATGILSQFLHTQFWHLIILSILSGIASGCYLTTIISVIMDQFEMGERQKIMGYQSIFVSVGAILCGFFGGLLAAWRWYGGYLVMLAGIPLGLLALFALPKEERKAVKRDDRPKKTPKLHPDIFYYTAIVMLFMTAYAVCAANLAVHISNAGMGGAQIAGTLTSFQMVGGACIGFAFGRLSRLFGDYLIAIAFLVLGAALTILNVFSASLPCAFVGVFLAGVSISLLGPQCIFSSSNCVDVRSSAVASSLINGLGPGIGSFLSPVIFTNLTNAIVPNSTNFRYQFVSVVALGLAVILAGLTALRAKRRKAGRVESVRSGA